MADHTANAARFAALYGDVKRCARCERSLPLSEFGPQWTDGQAYLSAYCDECNRQRVREDRRRSRDLRAQRRRAWAEGWPG
jgi:hypothetical protein